MSEQDNTLVTIHLDEPRQYRDRETYLVSTVGPGEVSVPRSVAEKWGFKVGDLPLAEPWPGYKNLKIDDIRQQLRGLTPQERDAVRNYEEANGPRKGIINVLNALADDETAQNQPTDA